MWQFAAGFFYHLADKINSSNRNKIKWRHRNIKHTCTLYKISSDSLHKGPLWPWSYGSWIYYYLCNQCLSPLMLWVRISIRVRCTTLCDKVCQWLATGWWFSPVSSTNKTDRHDITEILLKVVLNTIKQTNKQTVFITGYIYQTIIANYGKHCLYVANAVLYTNKNYNFTHINSIIIYNTQIKNSEKISLSWITFPKWVSHWLAMSADRCMTLYSSSVTTLYCVWSS